jgi:hypothetical protein
MTTQSLRLSCSNYHGAGWSGVIFALSVALAVQLPQVCGQPRGSHNNQAKQSLSAAATRNSHGGTAAQRQQTTKGDRSELLRYDTRAKLLESLVHEAFHTAKELFPPLTSAKASISQQHRGSRPSGICPPTITQSTSQAIVTNSVACSDPGIGTLENHYWRAFDMNTFTGGRAYAITSVEFGIEQAQSLFGTDQPLIVNLYINHGSRFPEGDWQSNLLVTSGELRIQNQEDTIFNVPLTAIVPSDAQELVMEVMSPDQTAEHNFFIIGSNPDPETGASYLSASDCGNPNPVASRCIGFPDMHYVFNVNGSCSGGNATPTPTPAPSCAPLVITGSIEDSDPTQNDRLNRGVISGCCGTGSTCQVFGDGQPHHYDAYSFTNATGSTQCVTVEINTDCQDSNFIFAAAYLSAFDPNNVCTNWLADEGQSPIPGNSTPFSFNIENDQTFILVVSEVSANEGCPSYTMSVSGLCGDNTPTPTPVPTATSTPTSTPTATARPIPSPRPRPTPRRRMFPMR